jgi:hypothetical protein
MTSAARTLLLDLGPIAGSDAPHPFTVSLDAAPLERLLADVGIAHRVYELALIERPGDLWNYLEVAPAQLPSPLAERLEVARSAAASTGAPWPEARVPFAVFDRHVRDGDGAGGSAAEAWGDACEGEAVHAFVRHLWDQLSGYRAESGNGSILVRHERTLMAAGTHPFAFLPRDQAIAASRRHPPNAPAHTEAFYAKLGELIGDEDVGSVSVRGLGDHRLLRLLCEQQRLRADAAGTQPADAFEISALTEREAGDAAWGAQVTYCAEEVGQGFLFVQDGDAPGRSVKELVEHYATIGPGGLILSSRDEGEIAGYAREQGEGWHLYRSEVTPRMLPRLHKYHSVWALMLAQENGELSDTQVVEIIAQWENLLSRRFPVRES